MLPHISTLYDNIVKIDLYTRQVSKDCSYDPLKQIRGICEAYGKNKPFPLPLLYNKYRIFYIIKMYLKLPIATL